MSDKEEKIYQREAVLKCVKAAANDLAKQLPTYSPGEIRKMLEQNPDFPNDITSLEWENILSELRNKQISPLMRSLVNSIRIVL